MRAWAVVENGKPLQELDLPTPEPKGTEVLLEVTHAGVCHSDIHIWEGSYDLGSRGTMSLKDRGVKLPLAMGHEIVGRVVACGAAVTDLAPGARVGVPWLGSTCGVCRPCLRGQENLCPEARFTGYQIDGGYAEFAAADHRFCLALPAALGDEEAAPLLCAGLIGHRAYRMTGDAEALGLYGFGAAAHILTQLAVHQGRRIYAFTRPGDRAAQAFARRVGAAWAGDADAPAPEVLDAAILFAPVGALVPAALQAVRPGGVVVCGGIHMSDVPSFPYALLWGERVLRSVANLTRGDGQSFFAAIAGVPLQIETHAYPLAAANQALEDLREGRFTGAAVLRP